MKMIDMTNDKKLNIEDQWPEVKSAFNSCIAASKHCSISTIGQDGYPHTTPIGFIFLIDSSKLIYFEKYSTSIAINAGVSRKVCISVVNTNSWFWFKSLLSGRFGSAPGLRLYGELGELRKATDEELKLYHAKIASTKNLKGSQMIWSGFDEVREISLLSFKPVTYPKMMDGLWGVI